MFYLYSGCRVRVAAKICFPALNEFRLWTLLRLTFTSPNIQIANSHVTKASPTDTQIVRN